jgi:hypothetical protein
MTAPTLHPPGALACNLHHPLIGYGVVGSIWPPGNISMRLWASSSISRRHPVMPAPAS